MTYSIKAFLIAGCVGCGIVAAFTACSADDDGGGDFKSPQTVTATPPVLSLNGASGYYTLPNVSSVLRPRRSTDTSDNAPQPNASDGAWQIVECPLWITPVKTSGLSPADTIKLYVSGNDKIKEIVETNSESIAHDVLATDIIYAAGGSYSAELDINGEKVTFGVEKN